MSEIIPFSRAVRLIAYSILAVSSAVGISWGCYRYIREMHANNPAYRIVAIVQSTSDHEQLNTAYLAELMNLSVNDPVNLYRFNTKEARNKLMACPVIVEAAVKKIRPGTVFVDYKMRKPIAFLSDIKNAAVDSEGYVFPFNPFFTPKRLPEIVIGLKHLPDVMWGKKIRDERFHLACELLKYLTDYYSATFTAITRIDVSKAYALSLGQRQIVVELYNRIEREHKGISRLYVISRILRLSTKDYKQGLANYFNLHHFLEEKQDLYATEETTTEVNLPVTIIDLRLPQLAFIKKGEG